MTPRGFIPRGVSFFEPKSQITQRNLNQNLNCFNPLVRGPWADPNYEKNWRSKISLDCPFKHLLYIIYLLNFNGNIQVAESGAGGGLVMKEGGHTEHHIATNEQS